MRRMKNPRVAYSGKVGAKLRALKHRSSKRIIKVKCGLEGGPFHMAEVWLSANSNLTTLPITVRGQSGQYINAKWVAQ